MSKSLKQVQRRQLEAIAESQDVVRTQVLAIYSAMEIKGDDNMDDLYPVLEAMANAETLLLAFLKTREKD